MDCLRKALSHDGMIEFVAVDARELVTESMTRIKAYPPAMIHLGQALVGSFLLLSITSKEDNSKVTLSWTVDGPFGDLYTECNQQGQSRGTIGVPQSPVQNLHAKLGNGILQVRRISHSTLTGLVSCNGDVCHDILEYLHQSEQRRTAMNLWVDLKWDESNPEHPITVNHALGYLVEVLPWDDVGRREAAATFWEMRLAELGGLSKWNIKSGDPTLEILKVLSGESKPKEILYQKIGFHCPCSRERAERALALAQKQDQANTGNDELKCEFCGKVYLFSK